MLGLPWCLLWGGLYPPLFYTPLGRLELGTIRVKRSFRQSIAYDTDDDGIANGYDLSPFGNGVPKVSSVSLDADRKINIKWTGLPSTLYRIEYKDSLSDSNWKVLTEYYNDQYIVRQIIHKEVMSNKRMSRFYRVLYIE